MCGTKLQTTTIYYFIPYAKIINTLLRFPRLTLKTYRSGTVWLTTFFFTILQDV